MRLRRPASFASMLAAALLLAMTSQTAPAWADGDPASDVLLIQDEFYPYQPLVSASLRKALGKTVSLAKAAGFPIKVALIESPQDLGAVPDLFGQPQRYAEFLDSEISFNTREKLLVVMPQGFGLVAAGSASALTGIGVGSRVGGSDALARAAMRAVPALAVQAGHPFTPPPIPASSGGGGGSSALEFALPVALVVLVVGFALTRRRPDADDAGEKA
jgi:hypothetical protein